jgi:hypothetical protein
MPEDIEGTEPGALDPTEDDYGFDPVAPATSPGPEASSAPLPPAPHDWEEGEVPPRDEEPQPDSSDTEDEVLPEFPPEMRKPFEGLLYIGLLRTQFTWMGHTFEIRTLNDDEILEVGLITKPYFGTIAEAKAYQTATVAACIERVDGQALPVPLAASAQDTVLHTRFRWVSRNYFPPTIDAVFEQYLLLDAQVEKVLEAVGNGSG